MMKTKIKKILCITYIVAFSVAVLSISIGLMISHGLFNLFTLKVVLASAGVMFLVILFLLCWEWLDDYRKR